MGYVVEFQIDFCEIEQIGPVKNKSNISNHWIKRIREMKTKSNKGYL